MLHLGPRDAHFTLCQPRRAQLRSSEGIIIIIVIIIFYCRFLATGNSYSTIAKSFRVDISSVSGIVPDVVSAFGTALWGSSWLCPPHRSGVPSQKGLRDGGTFLTAVVQWIGNTSGSYPLAIQGPSFTTTGRYFSSSSWLWWMTTIASM